jgi:uncharacterized membrane protein YccC
MSLTGNVITERTNHLRSMAYRISELASAFSRTGNQTVADELDQVAEAIASAAQEIHDAYYDELTTNTRQSIVNGERFIGSVLKGLLDGKQPKDACLQGVSHHLDRDLIEAREAGCSV